MHLPDPERVLTQDDPAAVDEADDDYRQGRTTRLV